MRGLELDQIIAFAICILFLIIIGIAMSQSKISCV